MDHAQILHNHNNKLESNIKAARQSQSTIAQPLQHENSNLKNHYYSTLELKEGPSKQLGFAQPIKQLASSKDGKFFATMTNNQVLALWDSNAISSINSIRNIEFDINSKIIISPNSQYIIVGGKKFKQRLFVLSIDTLAIESYLELNYDLLLHQYKFSPYSTKVMFTSNEFYAGLWTWNNPKNFSFYKTEKTITRACAISLDNVFFLLGCQNGNIVFYDLLTEEPCHIIKQAHNNSVEDIVFSMGNENDDKMKYITIGLDLKIKFWSEHDEIKCIATQQNWNFNTLAFSSYAEKLIVQIKESQNYQVWNLIHDIEEAQIKCYEKSVVTLLESSNLVVIGGSQEFLRIEDYTESTTVSISTFPHIHKNHIISYAYSSDGRSMATSSKDKTIKIYNMETFKCIQTILAGKTFRNISLTSNGSTLIAISIDPQLYQWQINNPNLEAKVTTLDIKVLAINYIESLKFCPNDRQFMIQGIDGKVYIYHIDPIELHGILTHKKQISHISASPDGNFFATTVLGLPIFQVWKSERFKNSSFQYQYKALWSSYKSKSSLKFRFIDFTKNSQKIVAVGHDKIILWCCRSQKPIITIKINRIQQRATGNFRLTKQHLIGSIGDLVHFWSLPNLCYRKSVKNAEGVDVYTNQKFASDDMLVETSSQRIKWAKLVSQLEDS